MLIGLSVLIGEFHVAPNSTKTVLAQPADASFGHNAAFHVVQFSTVVLLALAANPSFGGMPVLTSLLAKDHHLPHVFALRADRQDQPRYGGATPQPHFGIGAPRTTSAPGCELCRASRVPHSM
jgi:hypothetical protein